MSEVGLAAPDSPLWPGDNSGSGELSAVASGQQLPVDSSCQWTAVASGQQLPVDSSGEWMAIASCQPAS
jgi:hypothetical protein